MDYCKTAAIGAALGCALTLGGLAEPAKADVPQKQTSPCQCCQQSSKEDNNQVAVTPEEVRLSGVDRNDLDTSVSPREDFFKFATGGWSKNNPIPLEQVRWGTFNILDDQVTEYVHQLLVEAQKNPQSALEKKLGDLWASGMDVQRRESLGITPIKGMLDDVDKIQNRADLEREIAKLQSEGLDPYFQLFAAQDDKNSERMVATMWQVSLGLPERDYYIRDDADSKALRVKYVQYLAKMFTYIGYSNKDAQKAAKSVMALETRLAKSSLPAAELRDPQKVYNMLSAKELDKLTPHYNWKKFTEIMGIAPFTEVNVGIPAYMQAMDKELDSTPLSVHKDFLRTVIINSAASHLTESMENTHFDFYSKTMRGAKAMKPLWKRISSVVNAGMGQGLGEIYIKKKFSPEAKAKVQEMVDNIKASMAEDIPNLPWMSPATQKAALEKLNAFRAKIGYPDKQQVDYTSLNFDPKDYYGNLRALRAFEVKRDLAKIGKAVDRDEWHMSPQTVNAYYSPSGNEIVFPAAILQPPFFNINADDAVNYGGIGMVIGHEISHGFDDQGSQYDGQGNLRDWWTETDKKAFQALAAQVEQQFAEYKVEGVNLNGKLVLGESMADLSGLSLAWSAYQRSQKGKEQKTLNGFTPAQRFFLGYGKVWATNIRPQQLKVQIYTDPHPPAMWRVNGPLSNMDPFLKAFNVEEGDPMARPKDKRIKIW